MIPLDHVMRLVGLINGRRGYKVTQRVIRFAVIRYDDVYCRAEVAGNMLRLITTTAHVREVDLRELCRIDFMPRGHIRAIWLVEGEAEGAPNALVHDAFNFEPTG